ncbi:hypothetical protein CABS01_14912 [Colletotrichum abscissum]|uniref:Uncharacterized protein n=1 Tax=Colletotrichum abscissum TaxID=1671311 RepID=A0A9P9X9G1_9PEZI|nr:uncharacterized protein CABS01_14912 [Colletotrichum abscissum]KAI3543398.1 hypothetical protein CABS02_10001 [Colletotrichum abscissum]KAK1477445.1 hypothetical protein CABS01_14912 [Colletotrichum abscissum]
MANPQTPSTGAGAGPNILTPNTNASNLKPITKIRLLPSKPILTPPTTTGTTTPNPGTKPKAIKLKLKASSSSSPASAASRRRKLHRHRDVAGSRQSPEPRTPAHPAAAGSPSTTDTESTESTVSETPTPEAPATAPVRTYPSRFASLYATAARVDHWLNQQVALHAARVSPFSAFSAAAAANADPKQKPRILISTRNLTWMRASNGVWVKVPLASWKEKQMRPITQDVL